MNKVGFSFMDRRVKERLIGATILVVLVVLIVPELLSGPKRSASPAAPLIPAASGPAEPKRYVTVDLATSKATADESSGASSAASASSSAEPAAASTPGPAPAEEGRPRIAAAPAAGPPTITTLRAQQPVSPSDTVGVAQSRPRKEAAGVPAAGVPAAGVPVAGVPVAGVPVAGTSVAAAAAATAMAAAATSTDATRHAWAVQLGSFASKANADALIRRLRVGEAQAYVSTIGSGPSLRYRVRVGPLADRSAAERARAKLKKEGHPATLVAP
jgi:cell division septation protein DedD